MTRQHRPPGPARWLIGKALPPDIRRQALGDLDEEFAKKAASGPLARTRAWYWRQAVASLPSAWRLRRRSRRRVVGGGSTHRASRLAEAIRDLRHGLRMLRRSPLLTASTTLTIALAIGASTSVFTMAHAVLLRALPYLDPDALVTVEELDTRRDSSSGDLSWLDFLDYQARTTSFAGLAGYTGGSRTLIGAGAPDQIAMTEVTPGFFAVLGVRPAMGRAFAESDFATAAGAPTAVLITDRSWRRRFGGDPLILGKSLALAGQTATVVGVLPAEFEFPLRGLTEIWMPMRPSQAQRERRYYHWLDVIGRLKPGVSRGAAEAEMRAVAAGFAAIDPAEHPAATVRLRTLADYIIGDLRAIVVVLVGAAGVLLVIACTNIAGLLLSRDLARAQEIGVRASLGASPGRLARQFLVESLALAIPGAAIGVGAGHAAVRSFIALLPLQQRVSLPHLDAVGLDAGALVMSVAVAVLAAVACGVVPAWHAARQSQQAALRSRGAGPRETRMHAAFVATQVALALVLITGSALLGRSMHRLLAVSPGFDPSRLVTFRVNFPPARQFSSQAMIAFHRDLLEGLSALPAAAGAATISQLPLTGPGNSGAFTVQGLPGAETHRTLIRTVSDGYFSVMGLPLVAGRVFERTDGPAAPNVVVVNRLLAQTAFGGDAIGRRISFPFFTDQPWWEIVGVVGDEQFDALDRDMRPVVYFPYAQTPSGNTSVVMRVTGVDLAAVEPALRTRVAEIEPALPVFQYRTFARIVEDSDAVFRRRATLVVVGGFALAAIALAGVGLYGAVALMVSRRTREIGIRQALGATRAGILGVMLARGLAPALIGLVVGLAASFALAPLLASLMFGIGASDLPTLVSAAAFVVIVALVSALVPARRALRVDPVVALRLD